jgi:hypothetical protein
MVCVKGNPNHFGLHTQLSVNEGSLDRIDSSPSVGRRDQGEQLHVEPQRFVRSQVNEIGRLSKPRNVRNGCVSDRTTGGITDEEPKQALGVDIALDLYRLLRQVPQLHLGKVAMLQLWRGSRGESEAANE